MARYLYDTKLLFYIRALLLVDEAGGLSSLRVPLSMDIRTMEVINYITFRETLELFHGTYSSDNGYFARLARRNKLSRNYESCELRGELCKAFRSISA